MAKELKPGDPAPPFDLPTAGGGRVSLASLKGKPAVLYFYPKDDTPGCTQEALNFTEKAKQFAAAKAAVIGVSRDSAARHEKFAAKHGLNVTLAADEDGLACEAYGVWGEKKAYGKTYEGIIRSHFVIDEHGQIADAQVNVKPEASVEKALTALEARATA